MKPSRALAATLGAGLLFLSYRSYAMPREAARAYGIPLPEADAPTPFMLVKSDRDATLGVMLVVLAVRADARTFAYALASGAISPIADAAIVLRYGRPRDTAIHVVTALYILATAALARSGR